MSNRRWIAKADEADPDPEPFVARVTLARDPESGTWTASLHGAFGSGLTPGGAVDDLIFGLPDLVDQIDRQTESGVVLDTWRERRDLILDVIDAAGVGTKD